MVLLRRAKTVRTTCHWPQKIPTTAFHQATLTLQQAQTHKVPAANVWNFNDRCPTCPGVSTGFLLRQHCAALPETSEYGRAAASSLSCASVRELSSVRMPCLSFQDYLGRHLSKMVSNFIANVLLLRTSLGRISRTLSVPAGYVSWSMCFPRGLHRRLGPSGGCNAFLSEAPEIRTLRRELLREYVCMCRNL